MGESRGRIKSKEVYNNGSYSNKLNNTEDIRKDGNRETNHTNTKFKDVNINGKTIHFEANGNQNSINTLKNIMDNRKKNKKDYKNQQVERKNMAEICTDKMVDAMGRLEKQEDKFKSEESKQKPNHIESSKNSEEKEAIIESKDIKNSKLESNEIENNEYNRIKDNNILEHKIDVKVASNELEQQDNTEMKNDNNITIIPTEDEQKLEDDFNKRFSDEEKESMAFYPKSNGKKGQKRKGIIICQVINGKLVPLTKEQVADFFSKNGIDVNDFLKKAKGVFSSEEERREYAESMCDYIQDYQQRETRNKEQNSKKFQDKFPKKGSDSLTYTELEDKRKQENKERIPNNLPPK